MGCYNLWSLGFVQHIYLRMDNCWAFIFYYFGDVDVHTTSQSTIYNFHYEI